MLNLYLYKVIPTLIILGCSSYILINMYLDRKYLVKVQRMNSYMMLLVSKIQENLSVINSEQALESILFMKEYNNINPLESGALQSRQIIVDKMEIIALMYDNEVRIIVRQRTIAEIIK